MLVCHCKGVSERELRSAIEAGAASRTDVARRCGAGSVCGGCRPLIDELLDGCRGDCADPTVELAFAAS